MSSPILGIPHGQFLWIQVREENGLPVNAPATFVEYVETIISASLIENRQWDLLEWFAVNKKGGQQ